MERKAAAGKWKGGRRPFGYQVNPATSTLVPDPAKAAVVRLTFDLYTRDRLGARAIATALNERGHRTATGGNWSAHQVVRVLSNRVYLGELTFRGITATDCHPQSSATPRSPKHIGSWPLAAIPTPSARRTVPTTSSRG
ncbi:MAG TPA: recombinase family protein [Streptosporangiaceae bacterium]|nr:recombinase family protein [Streptosporangiaceae bacterium]